MVATGVTMPGGAGVKEFLEVMLKDCGGPTQPCTQVAKFEYMACMRASTSLATYARSMFAFNIASSFLRSRFSILILSFHIPADSWPK
jgi:hypothetical protein